MGAAYPLRCQARSEPDDPAECFCVTLHKRGVKRTGNSAAETNPNVVRRAPERRVDRSHLLRSAVDSGRRLTSTSPGTKKAQRICRRIGPLLIVGSVASGRSPTSPLGDSTSGRKSRKHHVHPQARYQQEGRRDRPRARAVLRSLEARGLRLRVNGSTV